MKTAKLILFVLFLIPLISYAQNDEMRKWTEYMTPGKEHQMLEKMNGDWNFVHKYYSKDPNAEPTVTTGTATCETLLDGRYSQMKINGMVMGMPFNGMSLTGFDNGKKIYISVWIDNMGTGVMYSEGKYDETSQTTIMRGKMYEPITDKDVDFKETIKWLDDKTMLNEYYDIIGGKETKTMEIKYTRK